MYACSPIPWYVLQIFCVRCGSGRYNTLPRPTHVPIFCAMQMEARIAGRFCVAVILFGVFLFAAYHSYSFSTRLRRRLMSVKVAGQYSMFVLNISLYRSKGFLLWCGNSAQSAGRIS